MKCIVHCMDKSESLPLLIIRVPDSVAHEHVSSGKWRYVSKTLWKQNTRDWKEITTKPTE